MRRMPLPLLVENGILDQATAIQLFSKVPRSEAEDRPALIGGIGIRSWLR